MNPQIKAALIAAGVTIALAGSAFFYQTGQLTGHFEDLSAREARMEQKLDQLQVDVHQIELDVARLKPSVLWMEDE